MRNSQNERPVVSSLGKSNDKVLSLPFSVQVIDLTKLEGILAGSELVVHLSEKNISI
jgi:hypothetical protein